MYLLGIDLGSSSVKASVIDGENGSCLATAFYPRDEMHIIAVKPGWAEQEPEEWWKNLRLAVTECVSKIDGKKDRIGAVGISYQMHGLVLTDKSMNVLRPSIIWCDSRAVSYGEKAFNSLGKDYCLSHLLNSPGNFTASKLAWVRENEPELYSRIHRIMLPGDYISMRMTGEEGTTFTGMSEGIFWDFAENDISQQLLEYFGFSRNLIPELKPSFAIHGKLREAVAAELGLPAGITVSYKAGDQPNNALSLNVLEPGDVAATAGTSGVIYGVTDQKKFDALSRVNTFLHVNNSAEASRLGVLLCINGTGILNSWLRRITGSGTLSYNEMNELASKVKIGADGISVLPFGNGSERMLGNRDAGAVISGLNFNTHSAGSIYRAAQEGIAFSFRYGLDIMRETGMSPTRIKAGMANMFLSNVFRETLAGITGAEIDLYNTDGSAGAARGAGIGCEYYRNSGEAFAGLKIVGKTEPSIRRNEYEEAYLRWKELLDKN